MVTSIASAPGLARRRATIARETVDAHDRHAAGCERRRSARSRSRIERRRRRPAGQDVHHGSIGSCSLISSSGSSYRAATSSPKYRRRARTESTGGQTSSARDPLLPATFEEALRRRGRPRVRTRRSNALGVAGLEGLVADLDGVGRHRSPAVDDVGVERRVRGLAVGRGQPKRLGRVQPPPVLEDILAAVVDRDRGRAADDVLLDAPPRLVGGAAAADLAQVRRRGLERTARAGRSDRRPPGSPAARPATGSRRRGGARTSPGYGDGQSTGHAADATETRIA